MSEYTAKVINLSLADMRDHLVAYFAFMPYTAQTIISEAIKHGHTSIHRTGKNWLIYEESDINESMWLITDMETKSTPTSKLWP